MLKARIAYLFLWQNIWLVQQEGDDMKQTGIIVMVATILVVLLVAGCTKNVPQLTDEQKELAVNGIKVYDEIKDAAISQDSDTLNLALIVGYSTNEETAKELGDSFVRMTKSFSNETGPGKEIGSGVYTYIIGVYYPDKSLVAMGHKCPSCDSIKW